jgi:type II secretory pathway pseudopilin PulG
MIFIIVMRTNRSPGLSLLEILIAIGVAGIIITTAFGTIGSMYFSQKKIRVSQDFHSEVRLLMERIVQMNRNNTIDYDRFFIEIGPNNCVDFDPGQLPSSHNTNNDKTNREFLGYESIFYWDTDGDGGQDRNLGGKTTSGVSDGCTVAWDTDSSQETLYLINGERTLQIAIKNNNNEIKVQKRLGADSDNDGKADIWSDTPLWDDGGSGLCEIEKTSVKYPVLGNSLSEDFCNQAHGWTVISPEALKIESLNFNPSPSRDPFLSFAVDEAQIHPHVFITLHTTLRNPGNFGLESDEAPDILLQTTVSSRVFGNNRKE